MGQFWFASAMMMLALAYGHYAMSRCLDMRRRAIEQLDAAREALRHAEHWLRLSTIISRSEQVGDTLFVRPDDYLWLVTTRVGENTPHVCMDLLLDQGFKSVFMVKK